MDEEKIKTLKILSIIMIILSVPYFNIFGITLSSLTYYGLQKKNACLLQSMLIPNLYEVIMIVLYFIGFFIKLKTSYNVKNKKVEIIISYILVILSIIQAIIQIYISINIYKLILKSFGTRMSNESDLVFIYNTSEESSRPEEDPLPAYSPPVNKLPSYSETQIETTVRNSNSTSSTSFNNVSIIVSTTNEVHSNTNILNNADLSNIPTSDITDSRDRISEVSINITPPPYTLYPTNNS